MARKAKRRNLSAAQIRAGFGGKRRKAAIKVKRRRHAPATKKRRNPPKRKRAVARRRTTTARTRPRSRPKHRRRTRKRNPELVSFLLGNPAKRRKTVKRRRKRAVARKRNTAGRRRRRTSVVRHRRRSVRNPGTLGSPMDWVEGAVGVTVGGVASRAVPQLVLGASNVGGMGYAANAAVALLLGWLSHMFFPRRKVLTLTVVAGGMAALLQRVITDKTSYGSILTGQGMGDYIAQDFLTPQRMVDGLHSGQIFPPGGAGLLVASEGAGAMNNTPGQGMSSYNLW